MAALSVGLVMAASLAHAERVAVLPIALPDAPVSAVELGDAFVQAARSAGAEVAREPIAFARARLESGAVPAAALDAFTRVDALVRDGWRAYIAADLAIARRTLEQARDQAAPLLVLPGGPRVYADIALRLGTVLLYLGHPVQARDSLSVARALDPERQVTTASFAPDVVEAYAAAGAAETAPVRVVTVPAGARVEIDGVPLAAASAESTLPLSLAPHLITARLPGHRAVARVVRPPDAPELVLELPPDPVAAAVLSGGDAFRAGAPGPDIGHALSGLLLYGEVESAYLIAGVWRGAEPALIGQRCSGEPLSCTRVVEVRYPRPSATSAAARELWSALASAPLVGAPLVASDARLWPARAAQPQPQPRSGCRLCRNPWVWTGVGATLATVGAVLLLTRHSGQRTPVITVDPCDFGRCSAP